MAGWWGEDSAIGSALDDMMGSWADLFDVSSLSTGNWWGSPMGQSFIGSNPSQHWSSANLTGNFLAGSGFYGSSGSWSGINSASFSRSLAVGMGKDFPGLGDLLDPRTWEETQGQNAPQGPGAGVGAAAGWEALNQFDVHFSSASSTVAQETGMQVPPNVVKALIGLESGRSDKQIGEKNCTIRPQSGCLAVWTGIFEDTAKSWGLDFNRIVNDPEYAIYAVTVGLTKIANYADPNDPSKTVLESYGWEGVATYYFGGANALKGGFTDELGRPSTQYAKEFMIYLDQLEGASSSPTNKLPTSNGKFTVSQGSDGQTYMASPMWGDKPILVTQSLGKNEFWETHQDWYDYSLEYGFEGHAGYDIGLTRGSAVRSTVSGTVTVVGSGYFTDEMGGTGEIRVQLDNGDEIIFGHMAATGLKVGDRVSPGSLIGQSGTFNGDHLHLEVRKFVGYDQNGVAKYKIVDPVEYLGGAT